MKKIVIVGGGVAGLTCAYILSKEGYDVTVLEKENISGGLARSFNYGKFTFDIGPHRFYISDKEVKSFIFEILGSNKLAINRKSGVFFLGKYHDWPLSWKTLFRLPMSVLLGSLKDFFSLDRIRKSKIKSFKDYIIKKYGKNLYNKFFRDYTHKFLKISGEKIHKNWSISGIDKAVIDKNSASGSLFGLAYPMIFLTPSKTKFIYPSRGMQTFVDQIVKKIEQYGGEVKTGMEVNDLIIDKKIIKKIAYNGKKIDSDIVIWTGPLSLLNEIVNKEDMGVRYLDLLIYNIQIKDNLKRRKYQWCYFGDKDISFSRVSVPRLFDKKNVPFGKDSLCVEVSCLPDEPLWNNPERIIPNIKEDLVRVGMIKDISCIEKIDIEKVSNAYPVYDLDYIEKISNSLMSLSRFKNLKITGRTGLFWYNNMDESIKDGIHTAKRIIMSDKKNN